MRVSDNLSNARVTMTFKQTLFGKITGESGEVYAHPITGGSR